MGKIVLLWCILVLCKAASAQEAIGESSASWQNSPKLFSDYRPMSNNSENQGSSPLLMVDVAPSAPPEQQAPQVVRKSWQYQATFSVGYSNIHFPEAGSGGFYNSNGPYIDADFAYPLSGYSPLIGGGITASGYFDNRDVFNVGTLYSDVAMISFEGRIAAPIPADKTAGIFLLPRFGAGLLFNNYTIDMPGGFNTIFRSYHNGVAFELRPSIEVGYRWSPEASAGVEASYMAAWGEFGSLGSMAQETRIGLVFSYRF